MFDFKAVEKKFLLGRLPPAPNAAASHVVAQEGQTKAHLDELLSEVSRQEAFWRFSDRLDKSLGRRPWRGSTSSQSRRPGSDRHGS